MEVIAIELYIRAQIVENRGIKFVFRSSCFMPTCSTHHVHSVHALRCDNSQFKSSHRFRNSPPPPPNQPTSSPRNNVGLDFEPEETCSRPHPPRHKENSSPLPRTAGILVKFLDKSGFNAANTVFALPLIFMKISYLNTIHCV